MKIICIQHADFETPGIIESWAHNKDYSFQIIKPYKTENFPLLQNVDFVLSMGGPQSPRDANHLPYLQKEIQFLKDAIALDKHVLGFCLGAQLIGEALGSTTLRSPEKEIGVFPITLTEMGKSDSLFYDFPSSFPVIHWHNDMPGSTPNATLLAESKGCPAQAYRYGKRTYGLQFHMEITKEGIEQLISNVPEDLSPSLFTQSQNELLQQDYASINQQMTLILDRFVAL